MKRLLSLLLFLLLCLPGMAQTPSGSHVNILLTDFWSLSSAANRKIVVSPVGAPVGYAPPVILPDALPTNTDATGSCIISNMPFPLVYKITVLPPPSQATIYFQILTNNLGTVLLSSVLVTPTNITFPLGGVAWTTTASDARYAQIGATNGPFVTTNDSRALNLVNVTNTISASVLTNNGIFPNTNDWVVWGTNGNGVLFKMIEVNQHSGNQTISLKDPSANGAVMIQGISGASGSVQLLDNTGTLTAYASNGVWYTIGSSNVATSPIFGNGSPGFVGSLVGAATSATNGIQLIPGDPVQGPLTVAPISVNVIGEGVNGAVTSLQRGTGTSAGNWNGSFILNGFEQWGSPSNMPGTANTHIIIGNGNTNFYTTNISNGAQDGTLDVYNYTPWLHSDIRFWEATSGSGFPNITPTIIGDIEAYGWACNTNAHSGLGMGADMAIVPGAGHDFYMAVTDSGGTYGKYPFYGWEHAKYIHHWPIGAASNGTWKNAGYADLWSLDQKNQIFTNNASSLFTSNLTISGSADGILSVNGSINMGGGSGYIGAVGAAGGDVFLKNSSDATMFEFVQNNGIVLHNLGQIIAWSPSAASGIWATAGGSIVTSNTLIVPAGEAIGTNSLGNAMLEMQLSSSNKAGVEIYGSFQSDLTKSNAISVFKTNIANPMFSVDFNGNASFTGNITNTTLSPSQLVGTGANTNLVTVTVGSGLTLSAGTLSTSGGAGAGANWATNGNSGFTGTGNTNFFVGTTDSSVFNGKANGKLAFQFDGTAGGVGNGVDVIMGSLQTYSVSSTGGSFVAGVSDTLDADQNILIGSSSHIYAGNTHSAIMGGNGNLISNNCTEATIAGGQGNFVYGASGYSFISGGQSNQTASAYDWAGGVAANALNQGCFVWSDSSHNIGSPFSSTANNQFLVSATGGVGINTNNPNGATLFVNGPIQDYMFDVSKTNGPVSYQLLSADSGKVFDNLGTPHGTTTNIYTLPNPAVRGWWAGFSLQTNGVLLIVATNSATINTPGHASAANGALFTSQLYSYAQIICMDGTNYNATTNGAFTAP